MSTQFYAVRMEPDQVVAAEISDRKMAELLDAGQSVVLASEADLHRLARLHGKHRVLLFRASRRPATQPRRSQLGAA